MTDPGAALAAQFGGVPVTAPAAAPAASAPPSSGNDALARQFGGVPAGSPMETQPADFKQSDTSPNDLDPNTVGTYLRHLWDGINPLNIGKMLPIPKAVGGGGMDSPILPHNILANAEKVRQEGNAAWEKGDKTRAVAKYIDSLIPVLGPMFSHWADQLEAGKYAATAGDVTGFLGPMAVGAMAPVKGPGYGATRTAPATAAAGLTAEEAAANAFGEAHGVPLDAATKTGSPFVRGVQKVAGESMLGSMSTSAARTGQASELARVGGEIADSVHPASVSPEQGGAGVTGSIRSVMADLRNQANQHYDKVRAAEADPANLDTVPLPGGPVDGIKNWQRGQLRRIVHELDGSGYTAQNYTHEGDYTPRSGGAAVYHDITEKLGHEGIDRGEVQEQIDAYLGGGKETAAVKAALDVAKRRYVGDRRLSTPELPASAMDVPTAAEQARKTSAQMPMAVDLRDAKAGVQPIYDRLKQENAIAPLQGGKADALRALDRLINGPDHAPLTVAEAALGDIKTIARTDDPLLRTAGQGVAAKAVKELSDAVNMRAAGAGNDTYDALHAGRAATAGKYAAADVLETLHDEPVKAFNQLTAKGDSAIEQLRQVQKVAPDAIPQLGRAKLEQWLDLATERGRFDHADKLYAEWNKLGPETKAILFGKAGTVEALDRFFLLAKRIAENPNPSGTAPTLLKTAEISAPVSAVFSGHGLAAIGSLAGSVTLGGIAKLMYSPKGVKALTRLLEADPAATVGKVTRPIGRAAARAAWLDLAAVAKDVGVPMELPKAADQESQR